MRTRFNFKNDMLFESSNLEGGMKSSIYYQALTVKEYGVMQLKGLEVKVVG